MTNEFLLAVTKRRSVYSLDKNIAASKERVGEIIEQVVLNTPSAFNSQSARVVLLWNEHHNKLWDITKETLQKIVPSEAFSKTAEKIDSFKAAVGTILFFDDNGVVEDLQKKFPLYSDNFPIWAQQANGMLQENIWVALACEDIGASLQHYNPLIDDSVKSEWNIPASWKLIAQMPFGNRTEAPGKKEFIPASERIKVHF